MKTHARILILGHTKGITLLLSPMHKRHWKSIRKKIRHFGKPVFWWTWALVSGQWTGGEGCP